MGMDASATLSYGIEFEEGYEFPWSEFEDIDEWWRKELDFKPTKEIYTEDGRDYLDGITETDKKHHWQEMRDFDKENPCPVELIFCGSYDYHSTIVAVPEPIIHGDWESATPFNPNDLSNILTFKMDRYYTFMKKYFKDFHNDDCKWLMTCLWG